MQIRPLLKCATCFATPIMQNMLSTGCFTIGGVLAWPFHPGANLPPAWWTQLRIRDISPDVYRITPHLAGRSPRIICCSSSTDHTQTKDRVCHVPAKVYHNSGKHKYRYRYRSWHCCRHVAMSCQKWLDVLWTCVRWILSCLIRNEMIIILVFCCYSYEVLIIILILLYHPFSFVVENFLSFFVCLFAPGFLLCQWHFYSCPSETLYELFVNITNLVFLLVMELNFHLLFCFRLFPMYNAGTPLCWSSIALYQP